uniref:DUF19 domain-containing protein n=1 Tax=Rhabditophanes sp. KR3021 TaxID=114890 RepID=A0AC35TUH4_9BILA
MRNLYLIFYLYSLTLTIFVSAAPSEARCPANTFRCGDNSCIPKTFVGDGEKDCSDGSDEAEGVHNTPSAQKSTTTKQTSEDPFANLATVPPIKKKGKKCTSEMKARRHECTSNLKLWFQDVETIDFIHTSILNDFNNTDLLAQGCEMMTQYRSCMAEFADSCSLKGPLKQWADIEMYACQLLLPAVREHGNGCFALARNARCPTDAIVSTLTSPFCRLVRATAGDLDCIESIKKDECNELANELLGPLKSETEHNMMEVLICETLEDVANNGKKVDEEDEEESETSETRHQTEGTTNVPSNSEIEPILDSQHTEQPIEETSAPERVEPKQVTTTQETPYKINLLDTLAVLTNLENICGETVANPAFLPIKTTVCLSQQKLRPHLNCFLTAQEKNKCKSTPSNNSTSKCEAIEEFNNNIDCIITAINDICPVEAQETLINVQEKLNDEGISSQCYQATSSTKNQTVVDESDHGFSLHPKHPKCTSSQENSALVCLVELVELNKQMAGFQNFNFLLEVSNIDSKLVNNICELYEKYEKCVTETVFVQIEGKRCAFNSPLNSLARVGLSPICSPDNRQKLSESKECIDKISAGAASLKCKNGLEDLGNIVQLMLQGIHGEALLCKTFYAIREAFRCSEAMVQKECSPESFKTLNTLSQDFSIVGEEEGCPAVEPANLTQIIRMPVKQTALPPKSIKPPTATPLAPQQTCTPEEQQKFHICVHNLTSFQPHPLAVIKQPRQIDEACQSYKEYKECSKTVQCNPLWAKGMAAMFEYACGAGYDQYQNVKGCIRKSTTRTDIRDCVTTFSKGAPAEACDSSKKLLECSIEIVREKCGETAKSWVSEYVQKFATAIDSKCQLNDSSLPTNIQAIGCSVSEQQLINTCAAPLNDISGRLDQLFEGGLQSVMKNVNNLAPVFGQGCNLTVEFKQCIAPIYANVPAAIDENLTCVFSNAGNPEFAKCLRSTVASIKDFNMNTLKFILPKFVQCIEPLVMGKCGPVPLNILKSFGSREACPIELTVKSTETTSSTTGVDEFKMVPVCDVSAGIKYGECKKDFFTKYRFNPVALINNPKEIEKVCEEVMAMNDCIEGENVKICELKPHKAFKTLLVNVCANIEMFKNHSTCISTVTNGIDGAQCLDKFMSLKSDSEDALCTEIQAASHCLAKPLYETCGTEVVNYAYDTMNYYTNSFENTCEIISPSVHLQTGCSEENLIEFLRCEAMIDKYHYIPVAILADNSKLNEFCEIISTDYKVCLSKLKCHFEPSTSASQQIFDSVCGDKKESQLEHGDCVAGIFNTPDGKSCLHSLSVLDMIARDGHKEICGAMEKTFECAGPLIEKKCTRGALVHAATLYDNYVRNFDEKCSLDKFMRDEEVVKNIPIENVKTITIEPSHDETTTPESIIEDTTTTTTTTDTPSTTTTEQTTSIQPPTTTTSLPTTTTTKANSAPPSQSYYLSTFSVLLLSLLAAAYL